MIRVQPYDVEGIVHKEAMNPPMIVRRDLELQRRYVSERLWQAGKAIRLARFGRVNWIASQGTGPIRLQFATGHPAERLDR